ncbi:MAG TPA: hypothetical protein PKY82_05665 [Pyrinomonadaceae bacterium]|nr:hypothetical protein [Pyrinomonadaceae bacterium]
MKVVAVFLSLFTLTFFAFGQPSGKNKNTLQYPNELEGFKLMEDPKLKELITVARTSRDWKAVKKLLPENCDGICNYNEDWEIYFIAYEPDGSDDLGIVFKPRKSISFAKTIFPKYFESGFGQSIYQYKTTNFIWYRDKYGLAYKIIRDDLNPKYKKGDLYSIEYGQTQEERKKSSELFGQ